MKLRLMFLIITTLSATGCDKRGAQEEAESPEVIQEMIQRAIAGKQLWEERCRTVAGERIYRTVEGVEGIVLYGTRRDLIHQDYANPMLPSAAFARERTNANYIGTFLGYEHSSRPGRPVSPEFRGYVTLEYLENNISNLPGYQYVDVIETSLGGRLRYTRAKVLIGQMNVNSPSVRRKIEEDPEYDLNIYEWTLKAQPAPQESPRYGVTIEDHVITEERNLGVASSTVRVIDIETDEILAELTRYVWAAPKSSMNPFPWARAKSCPSTNGASGVTTRKFVDKVLIPLNVEVRNDHQ
ncbi:MAG: hypothetical protein VW877_04840 [Pseudomonadaceae bacterium]